MSRAAKRDYLWLKERLYRGTYVRSSDPAVFFKGGWFFKRAKDRPLRITNFRYKIMGRRYRINFVHMKKYGFLGTHIREHNLIRVNVWQTEEEALNTIIHEVLHACFRRPKERTINRAARAISGVITKAGWTRKKK